MDTDWNDSQLAVTQDFISTVEDLQRLIKLNCSVTPSTFLRAIDVDPDVENSAGAEAQVVEEFSGLSDDSGYGNDLATDEDLSCSFRFRQLEIGPTIHKTPTKIPLDTLGLTSKTPSSLILRNSPAHEFKTPKTTTDALCEGSQKLSTPERLALEMALQTSSSPGPESLSVSAETSKPKPLFRKCFTGVPVPVTLNQVTNEARAVPVQPKRKFRLSSAVLSYKPNQTPTSVTVSEPVFNRTGTDKENPGPAQTQVTFKQQQVLEKYYRSKRKISAQKRTIEKLNAQLVYAKLDGCYEGLKRDNGTVISDIVVKMLSSENFMASRPQVIVQDPATELEMQHFKERVRAQKRNCDCPCYCDSSNDGPTERKRYFTSTLPPLD